MVKRYTEEEARSLLHNKLCLRDYQDNIEALQHFLKNEENFSTATLTGSYKTPRSYTGGYHKKLEIHISPHDTELINAHIKYYQKRITKIQQEIDGLGTEGR